MISTGDQIDSKEKCVEAAIEKHIGDISRLPEQLIDYVHRVYNEFVTTYLHVLRQKENKPSHWFPQKWSVDPELVDQMRHFFSDYQHVTKEFFTLNAKIEKLSAIDRESQSNLYEHVLADILHTADHPPDSGKLT